MRIAISGHSGCGNSTATKNVGTELGLDIINYTFRNLAQDLGLEFEQVQRDSLNDPIYDYLNDLMLIRASMRENVVIGTRLAAWIMDADLRIWLEAPTEVRAARIHSREQRGSEAEALYRTLTRDRENRQRYLELYGVDIDDHEGFDLTINTHQLSAEQVASLTVAAARWAQEAHKHAGESRHVARIKAIICQRLDLPETVFTDETFDVREAYARVQR